MPAVIRIDQERPGGLSAGTAGIARNDLWKGRTVHLRAADPHPDAVYSWAILTAPPGSSAALANPTTDDCSLAPDVYNHTYRVKLTQQRDGITTTSIKCLGIVADIDGVETGRGWVFPAFDERPPENNYAGNTRGTAPAIEAILSDIRTNGFGVGGGAPALPALVKRVEFAMQSGVAATNAGSGGKLHLGVAKYNRFAIDQGFYGSQLVFEAVLHTSAVSRVAHVELFDLDANVVVADTELTSSSLAPEYVSTTLFVTQPSGLYQARLWMAPGNAGQFVTCSHCALVLTVL